MRILLLGNGGREHALAWKLHKSERCTKLYIAPGNPGTAECGENIPIDTSDFDSLKIFCLDKEINMLVVGPEGPLVKGIYDFFLSDTLLQHISVIGPSKEAAKLEGSKAFGKKFMERHHIPTAGYREFNADNVEEGIQYLEGYNGPYVLKADGLAAGKGVLIIEDTETAQRELRAMITESKFGLASATVVVEQFLKGIEFSVFVLTDGEHFQILPNAKDYKRVGEGDSGLNTGGMGAISPVPFVTDELMQKVLNRVVKPTVDGLKSEGIIYKGFIYVGLILVEGEPYVIEYNCRMGDPETEVVMPRLDNDLVDLLESVSAGTLDKRKILISEKIAATVVLTSGGYPEEFEKEKKISLYKNAGNDIFVFHAGTKMLNQSLVTNGGRVMAITALGASLNEATNSANALAFQIQFEGKYFRKDIGYEFL